MSNKDDNVKNNITYILLYSFSLATALGFNNLILSIFSQFKWGNKRLIFKTLYVTIMFTITIGLAYYLKGTLGK